MRAYWLTWMWWCRVLMAACAILLAYAAITGAQTLMITAAVCLPVNALSAEASRRMLRRAR